MKLSGFAGPIIIVSYTLLYFLYFTLLSLLYFTTDLKPLSVSQNPTVVLVCTSTLSWGDGGGGGVSSGVAASELIQCKFRRRCIAFCPLEIEGLCMNFESSIEKRFLPVRRFVPGECPEHGSRTDRPICVNIPISTITTGG